MNFHSSMAASCTRWLSTLTRPRLARVTCRPFRHHGIALHRVTTAPLAPVRYASGGRNISGSQTTQAPANSHHLRKLLLFSVGTGSLYITYRIFHAPADEVPKPARNWQVTLYRKMPLKALSRMWGQFNEIDLPVFLRGPLLSLYVWMFSCKLDEAAIEDLKLYKNLGEFFRRQLKPHVRPIDDQHLLTSPSDGKILYFGKVENGVLEQVKGVTYTLQGFLGPQTWDDAQDGGTSLMSDTEYQQRLGLKTDHSLYHCIIYLAPGDYHRFHSPTDWNVVHRRHFPGELLSVNPGIARWVQGLFNFNERAVYMGQWEYGFFSMCAVGATNVGSIKIYCDEELETNTRHKYQDGTYFDKNFSSAVGLPKGSMFGEFNLGSTLVLIFEAPKDFEFKIKEGQKIKCGEPIGNSL